MVEYPAKQSVASLRTAIETKLNGSLPGSKPTTPGSEAPPSLSSAAHTATPAATPTTAPTPVAFTPATPVAFAPAPVPLPPPSVPVSAPVSGQRVAETVRERSLGTRDVSPHSHGPSPAPPPRPPPPPGHPSSFDRFRGTSVPANRQPSPPRELGMVGRKASMEERRMPDPAAYYGQPQGESCFYGMTGLEEKESIPMRGGSVCWRDAHLNSRN